MAFKTWGRWIRDGETVEKDQIDGPGTWKLVNQQGLLSYEAAGVLVRRAPGGGDPAGAVIQMALRVGSGTPANIQDATLTIPSLAVGVEAAIPERIIPQGEVCAVISGTVAAPFVLTVVQ